MQHQRVLADRVQQQNLPRRPASAQRTINERRDLKNSNVADLVQKMTTNDQMMLLNNIANNLPAQQKMARAKDRKVCRP